MPESFERKDSEITPGEPQAQAPAEGAAVPAPEARAEGRGDIKTRIAGRDAKGREIQRRPVTRTQRSIIAITWASIFFAFLYFLFMGLAAASPGYALIDRIASIFLLAGSLFIFIHGMGYANSMIKASWAYDEVKKRVFSPQREPNVVCVVACFNEPLEVLENTIAAMVAMDYANKEIVILDDSTKDDVRQGVREIAARYGASYRQRTSRRGYKAGAINDFLRTTDAPYIGVFDADGLPAHNLLRDLVPIIEENPRMAFVQTPQYYANTDVSNVALAASRQQAVFYEYICEGKSYSRSAFCCGTNVIFRRDALLAIGGFDETSVTEDFMTSLALHVKGYDSTYYNQVYAYSMAPETLNSYFTQQSRWAFGSIGGMWKVVKAFFTRPGALSIGQWWEYFLSTTYYWVGWVNFTFMLLPMLYIFLGVKPLRADVFTYTLIFIPYIIFSMNMFYSGMGQRGYKLGDMLLGQQIGFLTFPTHMTAAISGLIGLKRPFAVTPKGSGARLGWLSLWPQLLMLVLSAIAFVWGMWRYFISGTDRHDAAIVINAVWCLYHVILLSGVFRLNRTLATTKSRGYFESSDGRQVPVAAEGAAGGARVARPPIATPLRPTRAAGSFVLVFALVSLLLMGVAGWSMLAWTLKPDTPVNVYIVDRTTGRDYQEHRGLVWTLNQLKIKKQSGFHPAGSTTQSNTYDWARDFYGFVPGSPEQAKVDETRQADLIADGVNRLLPDRLQTPGVVYLADTYGEFVEYDYNLEKYVKYQSEPRGVTPSDVDKIQDFYNRPGSLLVAEWNTIGYPTLPGRPEDIRRKAQGLQAGILNLRRGLDFMQNEELPNRRNQLQRAEASGDVTWLTEMQRQVRNTEDKIENAKNDLARMQRELEQVDASGEQLAAQQQLQKMLHVDYQGWYGRYVDKFEEEKEYDWRLYKNVNTFEEEKFTKGLRGPGFVFFRDGPTEVEDPQTKKLQPNPFSRPIVITQEELGSKSIEYVSGIYRSTKAEVASDPLLKGVAASSPVHYWFDVVEPMQGATVLAWYKLQLKASAFQKLRAAGFPARYIVAGANGDGELVFPAAIAYRDAKGDLRSFYFAGDASDYPLVSRVGEMMPSTSGTARASAGRFGSYPQLFYWNFYEPILRNILTESKSIRYSTNANGG